MFDYFDKISIDYEILVQELKESFSENHLIIMDGDDKELSEKNNGYLQSCFLPLFRHQKKNRCF